MKLGSRCTTCGERIAASDLVRCEQCGRRCHAPCRTYEERFECPDCAEDLAIGAAEF